MTGRRASLLREMGLAPIWRLRTNDADEGNRPSLRSDIADPRQEQPDPVQTGRPAVMDPPVAGRPPGVERYDTPTTATVSTAVSSEAGTDRFARIATLDWDRLEQEIRVCTACGLCHQRKQAVPGVGDRLADWMLVGEGPGAEEDRRGEPFVGAAGKLLDAMLAAIGLKRGEQVYIANAVKCRPPHNRTPEPDEIAACHPYLDRQIELVQPGLLIALGRPAAQALLGTEVRINASRGRVFERKGIPVIVTYHPAYLLRNPADKAKAWEDLCFARSVANRSEDSVQR